jgi:PAS domain-containing protein
MWPFLEQHIEDRTFELVQDNTALQKEISERKLAEAFLTAIIEKSPISMWISDEKGTLVRANQACRDQLHVTDAELVGKYNILYSSDNG